MKYENHLIMAEGDMLMLHGRFSGHGQPANWIVLDIVRLQDGENWDGLCEPDEQIGRD